MDGGRRQGDFRSGSASARGLRVALLAAASMLLLAPAAGAQDDPYGSTTTTAGSPPTASVSCTVDPLGAEPGDPASVTITGLPPGGQARVLFGGVDVGATSGSRVDFSVPQLAANRYLVTAVGVGFAVSCHPGLDGVEVLAGAITRQPERGSLGALPRTGIFVGLLLAVAVVLLLLGRVLVEASHERRGPAARAAEAAVHERARDAERRGLVPTEPK